MSMSRHNYKTFARELHRVDMKAGNPEDEFAWEDESLSTKLRYLRRAKEILDHGDPEQSDKAARRAQQS